MLLKSLVYSQYEGHPNEWDLEGFSLSNINLLVGKNASGKSRTINVISGLGNLVSGDIKLQFRTGNYKATFENEGETITYILKYENSKVVSEKMTVGSKPKLDRNLNGKSEIWSEDEGKFLNFKPPENVLACVNRRDKVQHPFFEDLYQWGKGLRHYKFGEKMGKEFLAPLEEDAEESKLNLKDSNLVVSIFSKGERKFGEDFKKKIKFDMGKLGYEIDDINIGVPKGLTFGGPPIYAPLQGFILKESDLLGSTEQNDISQGMFRALSLIIQLNFSQLASIPSCILIDDIGEGLDYDRSIALIKLVIEKANTSSIQLIMSTNDRFVMNNVPLEYWAVILRASNKPKIYNYENAKNKFDEFELTGLSNFDFFSSGFFKEDSNKE
jgi:energy-coupling factor transporter ATP-binding protein EcfA2